MTGTRSVAWVFPRETHDTPPRSAAAERRVEVGHLHELRGVARGADGLDDRATHRPLVLPRLPLDRRVDVYAILWNRYAPFTDVLSRLTSRLRALRFDREAWAPIASLVPKHESVLKVDTLDMSPYLQKPRTSYPLCCT